MSPVAACRRKYLLPQDHDENSGPTGEIYGICALSLLEALILIMREKSLITEDELDDAFEAAIDAHRQRHEQHSGDQNQYAAQILDRLRVHGNSVRLDGDR